MRAITKILNSLTKLKRCLCKIFCKFTGHLHLPIKTLSSFSEADIIVYSQHFNSKSTLKFELNWYFVSLLFYVLLNFNFSLTSEMCYDKSVLQNSFSTCYLEFKNITLHCYIKVSTQPCLRCSSCTVYMITEFVDSHMYLIVNMCPSLPPTHNIPVLLSIAREIG